LPVIRAPRPAAGHQIGDGADVGVVDLMGRGGGDFLSFLGCSSEGAKHTITACDGFKESFV
jgi:hypothetical protein